MSASVLVSFDGGHQCFRCCFSFSVSWRQPVSDRLCLHCAGVPVHPGRPDLHFTTFTTSMGNMFQQFFLLYTHRRRVRLLSDGEWPLRRCHGHPT